MTDPVPQPGWRHMILLWKWLNWHFSLFYSGIFRTFIISLLKNIFHVQNLITFADNIKICVYRHTNNLINFVPELLICFHNLIICTNEITMYRHDILMWVLDLILCANRIIISTHRIIISVLGIMICIQNKIISSGINNPSAQYWFILGDQYQLIVCGYRFLHVA